MAVVYNVEIDQGADWFYTVTYEQPAGTPVDITGYTAALEIRSYPQSPTVVLELTTQNGGITLDGHLGKVNVHATAAQTALIDEGTYQYDLEIYSDAVPEVVTRLVQGQAIVSAEVTRGN